jgi:SAM-dependent methyltransferase
VTHRCRGCDGADLWVFLALGSTPLANALPQAGSDPAAEERFPLDVALCRGCSLVQILETVAPEKLFGEYLYFSSFSDTMVAHARALADSLIASRTLGKDQLVVEIASNDGYLLQWYQKAGVQVLGIEPARNIAKAALERGIPTRNLFFDRKSAAQLAAEGLRADVIHAHNVLAHVADLPGVVAGFAQLLAHQGVAVIEVPYVKDLIEHLEFDTIYHEHLCYFSLSALSALFERHGLQVSDVERVPIHGGSLRLKVQHRGAAAPSPAVGALLGEEREGGMLGDPYYASFAGRVAALKTELTALLGRLRTGGKRLAAYGASAKGSTLLNTFGIGADTLEFVVDRSPHKQGRLMPGVRLPISPPDRLLADRPDYVLLLTWNFADEIFKQQADFRAGGGKFIVPVPAPRIV